MADNSNSLSINNQYLQLKSICEAAANFLFSLRFSLFCCLVFGLSILQNGVWVIPNVETLRTMSQDVTRNMIVDQPTDHYLYTSFFGLLVANITGLYRSLGSFVTVHFVALCFAFFVLAASIRLKFGDLTARLFVLAYATVPLSNVLTTWLGISDVYIFLFGTALVMTENLIWVAFFSFLLALSHCEQAICIVALLTACRLGLCRSFKFNPKKNVLISAALVIGLAAGVFVLLYYFRVKNFDLKMMRIQFIGSSFPRVAVRLFFRNLQLSLFTCYNFFWIVVIQIFYRAFIKDKLLFVCLFLAHLALLALTAAAYDETRVFSLMVWPLMMFLVFRMERTRILALGDLKNYFVLAYCLGLAAPKMILWSGKIYSSALYYDLMFILDKLGLVHFMSLGTNVWQYLPFN